MNESILTINQTPEPTTGTTGTTELAAAVDELLDQLQHKFDGVSSEIFGKRKSIYSYPLPFCLFLSFFFSLY